MSRDSRLWEEAYKAVKWHKVNSLPVPKPIKGKPDPVGLQHELADVNKSIKRLLERKKTLQRQIKANGCKPISSEYFEKPIILYALQLEDGCYYIGQTRNVDRRYKRHSKGKGAAWTKLHKPLSVIETRNTKLTIESEAARIEDDMTIEYALKYGSELVRGGGYCQTKPRWPDVVIQNEINL